MSEYHWQETPTLHSTPFFSNSASYYAWRLYCGKEDFAGVAFVFENVGGGGLEFRGVDAASYVQKAPEGINTIDELKQYVLTLVRMGEL